jgi:hypothetical protein
MGGYMRRIAISVLAALMIALVGVPAAAQAKPKASAAPASPYGDGFVNQGPLISCVLATDCLGVEGISGQYGGQTATPTRVARWNGSAWKGVGVRLPAGAKLVDLTGVSCRGAKSCLVVGDYYKSAGSTAVHPLALVYNGTSLRPAPTVPLPAGLHYGALTGVSCVSVTHCVAVGMASSQAAGGFTLGFPEPVIETWNGARWALRTAATPVNEEVDVDGVSCATTGFCVVTGTTEALSQASFAMNLFLAAWNGKRLMTMKSPVAGGASNEPDPVGASCATPSSCTVTGMVQHIGSEGSGSFTPFTAVWNGRSWQRATVTWPKGTEASIVLGVSCYRARACEAVGAIGTTEPPSSEAVGVSYRGTASAVQSVPRPAKGRSDALEAVSCLPGGTCVAVGGTGETSADEFSVLMTGVWNGRAWKIEPGF